MMILNYRHNGIRNGFSKSGLVRKVSEIFGQVSEITKLESIPGLDQSKEPHSRVHENNPK